MCKMWLYIFSSFLLLQSYIDFIFLHLQVTFQHNLCLDNQVHLALLDPLETRESQVCPVADTGAWIVRTTRTWLAK